MEVVGGKVAEANEGSKQSADDGSVSICVSCLFDNTFYDFFVVIFIKNFLFCA